MPVVKLDWRCRPAFDSRRMRDWLENRLFIFNINTILNDFSISTVDSNQFRFLFDHNQFEITTSLHCKWSYVSFLCVFLLTSLAQLLFIYVYFSRFLLSRECNEALAQQIQHKVKLKEKKQRKKMKLKQLLFVVQCTIDLTPL